MSSEPKSGSRGLPGLSPKLSPTFVQAAAFILLSELCLVLSGAVIRHAADTLPLEMIVFARNALGLLLLLPLLLQRGLGQVQTQVMPFHILRALVGILAMYCFFYAWSNLPLAQAALIKQTSPFFIPLIAWLWLHEGVSSLTKVALMVGFLGVSFVLEPSAEGVNATVLVALTGAFLAAFAKVVVRRLSATEPSTRIVFYFSLYAALFSLLPALLNWHTPVGWEWGLLVLIALLTTVAQLLLSHAYGLAPAGLLAPYTYSSVVFAALLGWVFWGEIMSLYTLIGFVLIFGAGVINLLSKQQQGKV